MKFRNEEQAKSHLIFCKFTNKSHKVFFITKKKRETPKKFVLHWNGVWLILQWHKNYQTKLNKPYQWTLLKSLHYILLFFVFYSLINYSVCFICKCGVKAEEHSVALGSDIITIFCYYLLLVFFPRVAPNDT